MPDDALLTVDEVAAYCRTSPSTVRHWRLTGKGPRSYKVGRRVLYKAPEVHAWVEAQANASARVA